jgi:MYXO-CTERM domain-containing protein/uncharacterized repeat protein (TIGR01451 family)
VAAPRPLKEFVVPQLRFATALPLCLATLAAGLVSSSASAQVNLPFLEDWEGTNAETYTALTASLAGAPEWSFEPLTTGGRLRVAAGPGFYAGGMAAATLDRDSTSTTNVINYMTLTLDMTNYIAPQDTVVLDFSHMQHGDESSPNDRVWVRGSSSNTYVELYNLTVGGPTSGQYQTVQDVNITTALSGAGQQFTNTFQLRFGQEDNFDATSPTGTDGRTFDNILVRRVLNNDVAVQAIAAPSDQACGSQMDDLTVTVLNAGAITQSMIPLTVNVTGDITATFNHVVMGPMTSNTTSMEVVGQINTYPGVNINVTATLGLVNDEDLNNDTLSTPLTLKPTEITIPAAPADVCPGDSATINVQPEPLASFELYDVAMGGMPLAEGDFLVTPPVDVMTTFYVERINATVKGAAVDNAIGMGGPYGTFTDGLVFNVTSPIVVQRVAVYPESAGSVQVTILDQADQLVGTSMPFTVTMADIGTKVVIPVEIPVPIGNAYKMTAAGTTGLLYRNSNGAMYPYDINGWMSITGNVPNLADAYYFFYDWAISENVPVCGAERTPVDVDVDANLCAADLVVAMTGPASANPGDSVEYVTTVTNNGPSTAFATSIDIATPAGLTFVGNVGDCATASPCDLGDVLANATATITSTFTVNDDFDGTATVSASGTSTSNEANPGDESDSVDTSVMGTTGVGGGGGAGATGAGGSTSSSGGPGGSSGEGGGGAGDAGDDGGCGCHTAGAPNSGAPWAALLVGLGLGLARRRRRGR